MSRKTTAFTTILAVITTSWLWGQTVINGVRDFARISAPPSPASGFVRIFANDSTGKLTCLDSSGADCMPAGGGYATIQDEASPLTQRTTVNFTGAGVSCADNSGQSRTDCTITGGVAGNLRQVWNVSMGACDQSGTNKGWGQWNNEDANGAGGGCEGNIGTLNLADASTGKRSSALVALPANWASSDQVDVLLYLRTVGYVSSAQTKIFVETACRAHGESSGWSYNTASYGLRSIGDGDENRILSLLITNVAMTNCSAGELLRLRVRRADSGDADDTFDAKTVHVIGVQFRYKVTVD